MANYKRKPSIVKAIQYNSISDIGSIIDLIKHLHDWIIEGNESKQEWLNIKINNIIMQLHKSDWFVKDEFEKIYILNSDIFEKTFKKISVIDKIFEFILFILK